MHKQGNMLKRETTGARIGARLRARANTLAPKARKAARRRGMDLIYGVAG